jgi:hypothetical protein
LAEDPRPISNGPVIAPAQVLEDAERLIAAWNERQAKANTDTVLARCRFVVVGHSYNLPARCSAGSASFL